jgi:hypothetical protein
MHAVLDTNILIANLRGLRPSNDLKLVLADSRAGGFKVVVPDLVIEEIVNRRREDAQDAERNLRKAQSDLAAVGATLEVPTFDAARRGRSIGSPPSTAWALTPRGAGRRVGFLASRAGRVLVLRESSVAWDATASSSCGAPISPGRRATWRP